MYKSVRKGISIALCAALIVASMGFQARAGGTVWANRAVSPAPQSAAAGGAAAVLGGALVVPDGIVSSGSFVRRHTLPFSIRFQSLMSALPSDDLVLHGAHDAKDGREAVVLIQDVHLQPEAQTRIASALQSLIDKKQVGLIGAEGAFRPFPLAPFREFPRPDATRRVADAWLRAGRLAAPSYVGITSPTAPPLMIGVDDKDHYNANVRAYRAARSRAAVVQKQLARSNARWSAAAQRHASPSFRSLFLVLAAWDEKKARLPEFVEQLAAAGAACPPVIREFQDARAQESRLDLRRVEDDYERLFRTLERVLPSSDIRSLAAGSLEYRAGRVSFADFYERLRKAGIRRGVDMRKFPWIEAHARARFAIEAIDGEALRTALRDMEKSAVRAQARTAREKVLARWGERLRLVKKLASFSLTPEEWNDYETDSGSLGNVESILAPFEDFYQEADARSRLMLERLLSPHIKGPRVLIAGGFHTSEIVRRLKDADRSYVVATPRVTQIKDQSGTAYLSIFAQEKTPLDALFNAEALTLSPVQTQLEYCGPRFLASRDAVGRLSKGPAEVLVQWEGTVATARVTSKDPNDPARYQIELTSLKSSPRVILAGPTARSSRLGPLFDALDEGTILNIHRELLFLSQRYKNTVTRVALDQQRSAQHPSVIREAWLAIENSEVALEETPALDLPPGTQIGRFRIVERISGGGFGAIYKAVDLDSRLDVVLKTAVSGSVETDATIFHGGGYGRISDFVITTAFLIREGKRLREMSPRLDNVPQFIDGGFDTVQQRNYVAMELLKGDPLSRPKNPLNLDDAGRLARSLQRFHEGSQAAHGDLTPKNILVTRTAGGRIDEVHFVDLGSARVFDGEEDRDRGFPHTLTEKYTAPEQIQETTKSASDVFSLALVLCDHLAPDILRRPDVVDLFHAALAENPSDRPTTMDFATQLEALAAKDASLLLPKPLGFLKRRIQEHRDVLKMVRQNGVAVPTPLVASPGDTAHSASAPDNAVPAPESVSVETLAQSHGWQEEEGLAILKEIVRMTPSHIRRNTIQALDDLLSTEVLQADSPQHRALLSALAQSAPSQLDDALFILTGEIRHGRIDVSNRRHVELAIASMKAGEPAWEALRSLGAILAKAGSHRDRLDFLGRFIGGAGSWSSNALSALAPFVADQRIRLGDADQVAALDLLLADAGDDVGGVLRLFEKTGLGVDLLLDPSFRAFVKRLRVVGNENSPVVLMNLANSWEMVATPAGRNLVLSLVEESPDASAGILTIANATFKSDPSQDLTWLLDLLRAWKRIRGKRAGVEIASLGLRFLSHSGRTVQEMAEARRFAREFRIIDDLNTNFDRLFSRPTATPAMVAFTLAPLAERDDRAAARAVAYFLARGAHEYAEMFYWQLEERFERARRFDALPAFLSEQAYAVNKELEQRDLVAPLGAADVKQTAVEKARLARGRKLIEVEGLQGSWHSALRLEEALALFPPESLNASTRDDDILALTAVFFKDRYSIRLEIVLEGTYAGTYPLDGNKLPVDPIPVTKRPLLLERLKACAAVMAHVPYEMVVLNPSFSQLMLAQDGRDFLASGEELMLITLNRRGIPVFLHELGHAWDPLVILASDRAVRNPFHRRDPERNRVLNERLRKFAEKHNLRFDGLNDNPVDDLSQLNGIISGLYRRQRDRWRMIWRTDDHYDGSFRRSRGFWRGFLGDLRAEKRDTLESVDEIDRTILSRNDKAAEKAVTREYDDAISETEVWVEYEKRGRRRMDKLPPAEQARWRERRRLLRPERRILRELLRELPIESEEIHHRYVFEVLPGDPDLTDAAPYSDGRLRRESAEWFAERARKWLSSESGRQELYGVNEESGELFDILFEGLTPLPENVAGKPEPPRPPIELDRTGIPGGQTRWLRNSVLTLNEWDPLESTCRHASLSIL